MQRDVFDSMIVPWDFEVIQQITAQHGHALLEQAAATALTKAHEQMSHRHIGFVGFDVGDHVAIEHEVSRPLGHNAEEWRVSWTDTDHPDRYPDMLLTVQIAALSTSPPRCEISMIGHYTPTRGIVGAIGDRISGHTFAEATVHRCLEQWWSRLQARAVSMDLWNQTDAVAPVVAGQPTSRAIPG